jgi:hypothetical protein
LASGSGNGNRSVFFDNYYIDVQGKRDLFVTAPAIQADEATPVSLFFDVAYARYAVNYSDTLAVYVSEDCGQTRTLVYLKGGEELATAPDFSSDRWVPASSEWRAETISDLPLNFSGDLSVLFENRGRYGQPIYIDNIRIESVTGVNLETAAGEITPYPNPTTDRFYLRIDNEVGDLWVTIADISGRTISNQSYQLGSSISLEPFPNGVYTVKLINLNQSRVFKIIKQ